MSKKGLKTMLVCIVLLIGLVTLFACNKSDVADKDGQTKVIVKIQDEDGSIYKENVVFSDLFTLSLQKEGYTGRLYRDADFLKPLTKDSKVKNGDTVYVKWTINKYTVTFMDGEKVLETFTNVRHGSAVTAPEVPEKDGKTFKGWDKDFKNITSDLIVNAKFETKKFTLTFINFDGTTVYTAEVEYGAPIDSHFETADSAATYDDTILDYDGWYKADGTRIDELDLPTMPAENFTLTLKLRLMDSAIGEFKVNTPADFTFTESNTAEFSVMPNEGTTLRAGVTYKYIWTINKDNVIYKTEETTLSSLTLQNLAAGEYLANVKIVASVENCGSVEKDFSADETLIVSRADISGIAVTGVTMTYGDKTAEIGISGLREGDVVTYGTDGTAFPLQNVDLSALDCGEYDYFVRVYRGDNYNPYTSGKITVTINKATVSATVTPDDDKLTYGDNLPSLTAAINGETYTIESGKYELHLGMTSITGNVANNVGTYNIENVDISDLRAKYPEKNYNIALTTVGTITINKANLTVTVTLDKTELTYGEVLPKITYKFDGLKLSDTEENFTITKTEFAEKLDVGTYTATVTLSGEKTNFYNITVNTVEFKVNKKSATITINKVDDIEYGDKVPDLSAKVEVKGVLDGDSLSYTLNPNYEVGNKPGDYTASVEFNPEAAENKNYAITATGRTFNVGTKDLTIKLNNTATVAVGKTYKVEAEHLEKIGLVAGDTVTGCVTITKDVAGTYYADDFDKSNLVVTNADCYVISYEMSVTFVEVTFAIDFADVTLTYDGQPHGVSVTKTDESKNYTITYGTTENDCTLNSSPVYTNAGAYAYKIYFKVVDNDTLAEHVGYVTLTINKKAVTVKFKDVTITYGGTPKFEYTVAGLVDGETLSGEAVYSGAGTYAGEYDISVSGLTASDNYKVTFVTGKLTINKKEAKVDWTIAENYVYSPEGQTLPTATYDGNPASLIFTKTARNARSKTRALIR
ncbi:MAG: InlB B-repeat-containing protein [Clostridium sp.]|nr:MAG: InlB B-repeat-containing protein [Clostridium sp.]